MKIYRFLLVMTIFAVTILSCTKDEQPCIEVGAKFFSTIGPTETRASNTSWTANDAIGIYALNTGTTLASANIYDGKANIKHTTTLGNGVFEAAVASDAIIFPLNGDKLDFIAYYPYKTTITNYIYPVDVAVQSNLEDIDLLYSNNATAKDNSAPVVTLNFKHLLSKLVLNIEAGDGIFDLTGLAVSVNDLNTKADFSLIDGTIPAASLSTPLPLTPNVTVASDNLTATTEAILIPTQDLNTAEIVFTLNGETYKWAPSSKVLAATKKYTYNIKLSLTGVVAVEPDGTIEDWGEDGDPTGTPIELNPEVSSTVIIPGTTLLDFTAATPGSLPLTFDATESWTIAADETWVTFSNTSGAAGTGLSVDVNVTANAGTARTATITITPASGDPVDITVTQIAAPPAITGVTPTALNFTTDIAASLQLTFDATENWTIAADETWVTFSNTSGAAGTGLSVDVDVIANAGTARTATITITPATGTPVDITVTQAGIAPATAPLFPGADFENWSTFTGSLSTASTSLSLKSYVTQSATGGQSGSSALLIDGAVSSNEYAFTVLSHASIPANPTKITFYIKGTATGKSLSFNVYSGTGIATTDAKYYNLGICNSTTDVTLNPTSQNSYTGSIDTQGAWVKITLDISTLTLNTSGTGNIFALKTGSSSTYDLLVDNITIE